MYQVEQGPSQINAHLGTVKMTLHGIRVFADGIETRSWRGVGCTSARLRGAYVDMEDVPLWGRYAWRHSLGPFPSGLLGGMEFDPS